MHRSLLSPLFVLATLLAVPLRAQLVARGPWTGAITDHTANINLVLFESRLTTLEYCTNREFSRYAEVPEQARREDDTSLLTRYQLRNLEPDTTYYFRVRAGRRREEQRIGSLHTLPTPGQPASFRFALIGGAETASEAGAFSEVRFQRPLFVLQLGNLHKEPIGTGEVAIFQAAYNRALDSFTRQELLQSVPLVYTWGDLDFSAANSDIPAAAAHRVYRQFIPHYPLPADADPQLADRPESTHPIAQAFSVGRVRFIVLDVRTNRTPDSLLGPWQRQWLEHELQTSAATHPLIFVASPLPWHAAPDAPGDHWGHFAAERESLTHWIQEQHLTGVVLLSAGGGMLSAVDAKPAAPAEGDEPVLPEFQVGDVDLHPAIVTGSWTNGPVPPGATEEFFGLVDIDDQRTTIKATLTGMNQNGQERLRTVVTVSASSR